MIKKHEKSSPKKTRKKTKPDYGVKTKLPTQAKTKLSICPICSKKRYNRNTGKCSNCKFEYTPDRKMTLTKASKLK